MPLADTPLDENESDILERFRQQYGLPDLQQATEWLLKSEIRIRACEITGRNRALYPVEKNST
ncbi:hypothetical protein [Glaciimonas sp. PAMC28666]|uniref:hypothetical protein n=1 Tax=Glaciimonas sp. PAMC28666 TaxID=2807626 RepID=UPI00196582C7|nr:hypothetical protein [Glaciimonas sp. PAMC28666]QRX80899.1 hypothetical protein JQN73_11740 [Glaciimonas sp. PAMC28666]